MISTHLMTHGLTACGIDPFTAGELRSSPHKAIVTCEACKDSVAFKQAVQRFPVIPPHPSWTPVQKAR